MLADVWVQQVEESEDERLQTCGCNGWRRRRGWLARIVKCARGRGADASASGRYTLEHVLESTLFFTRVVDSHGERKQ